MGIRTLCIVLVSILFISCFSIKPQVSKTGVNLWEEFYVSPGVMQYFIKPLQFKSQNRNIEMDFTFRNVSDSVTVNYSIFSELTYFYPDTLTISNGLKAVHICSSITLVSEIDQKKYKLRQSGKISLAELKILTKDNNWAITLQNNHEMDQLFGSNKTKDKIKSVNDNLVNQMNN